MDGRCVVWVCGCVGGEVASLAVSGWPRESSLTLTVDDGVPWGGLLGRLVQWSGWSIAAFMLTTTSSFSTASTKCTSSYSVFTSHSSTLHVLLLSPTLFVVFMAWPLMLLPFQAPLLDASSCHQAAVE
ncbi:hypothetical protein IWX91DRAFT_351791 [Phyllosticta citricarpa]